MRFVVLGIAAAALLTGGSSLAQTQRGMERGMAGGTVVAPSSANGSAANHSNDATAASGNNNQAVATTSANAPTPAKGANSFTMGEARNRIEKSGFSSVSGLTKDNNGIWRGTAQKNGGTTPVWLDYKGNVGEGK